MWFPLKGAFQLIFIFLFLTTFTSVYALDDCTNSESKKDHNFNLKSIDRTPKVDLEKIKKTMNYPLDYREAIQLLEQNLLNNRSLSSLFHYTYLSEESKNDGELTQEQVLKTMIKYLKESIIKLNQKELDGKAWPKLNSKTHLLFILSYNMDGFTALVKFIIDRKIGSVSIEEIAD